MISRQIEIVRKSADFLRHNSGVGGRPLAYVGGWLRRSNLGDEALFQAAERLFPGFSLWHFDGSRTLTHLLNRIPRTTQGLYAGGTLINRCPEYLELGELFLRRGRRLSVFGTGVADPDFWTGRGDFVDMLDRWKPFLERCEFVGVRGPRSAELLADAGVRGVEIVGDPAIAFAGDEPAAGWEPDSLGLNVGYAHGNQWGAEQAMQQEYVALAKMAKAVGWRVRWFVVFPRDLAITRDLAAASGTAESIHIEYASPARFVQAARSVATFVGMKLHATLLAICAGVPSLMVEYDPKCMDFMASIDQRDAVVRADRFGAGAAWDLLTSWNSDRDRRSRSLHTSVAALKRRQRARAAELASGMLAA